MAISNLLTRAAEVKNETIEDANSATRVGALIEDVIKEGAVVNVTTAVPLGAGLFYSSVTARAAVPVLVRKLGLEITYATGVGVWVKERFVGSDVVNWGIVGNWENKVGAQDTETALKLYKADVIAPILAQLADVATIPLDSTGVYGDGRRVTSDGFIYTKNVTSWKNTGLKEFPAKMDSNITVFTNNSNMNRILKELYLNGTLWNPANVYKITIFDRCLSGNSKWSITIYDVTNGIEVLNSFSTVSPEDSLIYSDASANYGIIAVIDWTKMAMGERLDLSLGCVINNRAFEISNSPIIKEIYKPTLEFGLPNCFGTKVLLITNGTVTSISTNMFGKTELCQQIVVPTSGIFKLRANPDAAYAVDDIINCSFILYSPFKLEITPSFNISSNMNLKKLNLKKGINYITIRSKLTAVLQPVGYVEFYFILPSGTYFVKDFNIYAGEINKMQLDLSSYQKKEAGKGLSEINFTQIDKTSIVDIQNKFKDKITNISNFDAATIGLYGVTKTVNGDGSLRMVLAAGNNEVDMWLPTTKALIKNHSYFLCIDMLVAADSNVTNGNFYFNAIYFQYPQSVIIATNQVVKNNVIIGTRGYYKDLITITGDNASSGDVVNYLKCQFAYGITGGAFDATIYKATIIDMGITATSGALTWDDADKMFTLFGFSSVKSTDYATGCDYAQKARVAESVESIAIGTDIEIWGDSLTAQNWGQYLAEKTGRNIFSHGYGGHKSGYIRDQFFAGHNKDRMQIIWAGRNNYQEVDTVCNDVREMVDAYGEKKFLIMCPPNGSWGTFADSVGGATGEAKGGTGWNCFMEISRKLAIAYPNHFIDIRQAVINQYNYGNVKLLAQFVQPTVNGTVQISVSNTAFLTTYNTSDVTVWGTVYSNFIRIGFANGLQMDKYEVVSVDSSTLMTVKLSQINRISAGDVVKNTPVTFGGDNSDTGSVNYLQVMQNLDYECLVNDITPSTLRSDGIHMTTPALQLVAKIIGWFMQSVY